MDKKKKTKIIVAVVLCICVLLVVTVVPSLYVTGSLATNHPLNKPKNGQIRVACVGDSITFGAGVEGWPKNNYPSVLGNMLGDKYCVNNYGYSARTAMYSGDYPFANEALYRKSLSFNPDIVVIMFGSNDSKPYNWKGADAFKADYKKLIDTYLALDSHPAVYLITPPPVFENGKEVMYDIQKGTIANEIRPAVIALGASLDLPVIDMYAVFEGRNDLFSDGVHPNADGAKLFAETVYNFVFPRA